ncbi:MAG: aminotransferase class V-fold PLP-dependent enzyme [Gammaproteobacteria bacterium]|nr:aminotransferase class V-fold PLP-dependent enzyme [Pseudomonadales bacterium]MCP5345644.1 aminotransferase class V-fold PLP-dependent enzyme [Pseudomonadales bacterium]
MKTDLHIIRLRAETPACENLIHFNNAGASLSPSIVTQSVAQHLQLEQLIGGYEAAEQAAGQIENFYPAFARLLNCDPAEMAFIENATRAWDMAFYAVPFQPGDQVITGQAEYASNYLAMLQLQKRLGIEIVVIANDAQGMLDLDSLREHINRKTRLIALTHIPSQIGTVQPAAEVGTIARGHGILYLLDACQSAGQLPLDTQQLGCDLLTGTGRKYLRGPRGTGFLYVNRNRMHELSPPFIDLHSARWVGPDNFEFRDDARRFENWECFVAGKIGLGVAADYAHNLGLEAIQTRISVVAGHLANRLREAPGVTVHEKSDNRSGIVTFSLARESAPGLQQRLRRSGINISVSRRVNAQLDSNVRQVGDVCRASLHYYNTVEEIDRFIAYLNQPRS